MMLSISSPVTSYMERTKAVYLPEGTGWYDFYSGKYFDGGKNVKVNAPLDEIPLLVRKGSIIPTGPVVQYAEEKTNGDITLYVYAGKDGEFTLYEDEDNNNDYQKGIYSTIKFSWNQAKRALTIGKRNGDFPGMITARTINVVVVSREEPTGFGAISKRAKSVKYDGRKVTITF